MMLTPDHQLLERYLREGDHLAFAALVERFLPLVQCAALRVARDQTLAEEASQIVFTRLSCLRRYPFASLPLVVWLHRTTRSVAIDLVRAEASRRKREQAAALAMSAPTDFPWEQISPLLDQALGELSATDRHLVLARYFQGESHAQVADALGLTMEAAKKRTARALEKLRTLLGRRGVTTTAAVLALALPAHAVTPAAPGQVMSVATTALKSAAITGAPVAPLLAAKTLLKTVAIAAALAVSVPVALFLRPRAAAPAPALTGIPAVIRASAAAPEMDPGTASSGTNAGDGTSTARNVDPAGSATGTGGATTASPARFGGPTAAGTNTNLGPTIGRPPRGTTLVGSNATPPNHE